MFYGLMLVLITLTMPAGELHAAQALTLHSDDQSYDLTSFVVSLPDNHEIPSAVTQRLDYDPSSFQWYAFTLDNRGSQGLKTIFVSQFPLRNMLLFDRGRQELIGRSGTTEARKDKITALSPAVPIPLPGGVSEYLLAIRTDGNPFVAMFRLEPENQFYAEQRSNDLMFVCLAGGCLGLVLYYVLYFLALREWRVLFQCLTIAAYLGLESVITGIPQLLNPPYSVWMGNSWFLWDVLSMIGLTLFTREYFNAKTHYPRLDRAVNWFALFSLAVLPLSFLQRRLVGGVYISMQSLVLLANFGVALDALRHRRKGALTYLLAYVPALCALLILALQLLHLVNIPLSFNRSRYFAVSCWALLLSVGYSLIIDQIRVAHRALRSSLSGMLPQRQIDKIIADGHHCPKEPVHREATIMFIDIVGSSKALQDLSPEQSFEYFKVTLNEVAAIVHKHDGMVDRSLGDGIRSIFGYELGETKTLDHALRAFTAAIEIQHYAVQKVTRGNHDRAMPPLPLRIGINSATVTIGNMGDDTRLDMSLAGEGVFIAKKFEASCEPHKIVTGSATFNALPERWRKDMGFTLRYLPIKSQDLLMEGYEYNPFWDNPAPLLEAHRVFWQIMGSPQRDPRLTPASAGIFLDSEYGPMEIVNFSSGGLCLKSSAYLGRGAVCKLTLTPFLHMAQMQFISPVIIEVMWGTSDRNDRYLLGVRTINLNDVQTRLFLKALQGLSWEDAA